jgi:hypothetical protein
MIYNFTSVKTVIAKVLADNDAQEEGHRLLDYVAWAGEAIERIGGLPLLVNNITGEEGSADDLCIEDYRAALPDHLYQLKQVLYTTAQSYCSPHPI